MRSGETGAAAVEFALVLPLLLLIVFGMIDTGLWLNDKITATDAARQGLRTYLLTNGDEATKETAGRTVINRELGRTLAAADVTFTACALLGTTGVRTASVSFSYDAPAVTGFIPGWDTLTIGGQAESPCD